MKKHICLIFLLIFLEHWAFGLIVGTGTFGDPYTGTLSTGSFTISGTKYFDVIAVSGGTLTISAGATLFAVATTSGITISLTGILSAVGTSGSIITFSADNDGDGSPSPIETWKNILFDDLCSGASVINYAIVENGTGDDYTYGGGIDIWGNNITISNSTIRNCNNSSGSGGGISATPSGSNVTLLNLKIHDNIAAGNGGGIFTDGNVSISGCEIYNNSASSGAGIFFNSNGTISNSIIRDNTGGEGIYSFGSDANGSITNCILFNNSVGVYFYGNRNIVNSTIVNNTTGLTSASSVSPKVINTVLWGNTTQYTIEPGGVMELAYCGIQGGFSVGTDGGGNTNLSSTNGANTGPNFIISSSDFHINAGISPLVDGGTSLYSGISAPGSDIEGKSRISTTDIGAYEFFYYMWNGAAGTTAWATSGNWVGSPSSIPTIISESRVLIPKGCSFYPTTTALTLSSRSILTIEPQAGLTVTGATAVNSGCTFHLRSDASGTANFITGSAVTGTFNVELFLAGGGSPNYRWHYVTTPVTGITKTVLTTNISNSYNLLNYIESRVTTDKFAGWNWHDGVPPGSTSFNTLLNTFGYNVYVSTDKTALFTGPIRAGTLFTNGNITFTSTDPAQSGWNLIGNPFTCGVNANLFTFGSRLDIDKTVYFTKDNQYCSWSVAGNAGINGATNIVPPMQGFFVHAASSGAGRTLSIPTTSRVYTTNPIYKKGEAGSKGNQESRTNPYLKFNISDGASFTDESIIYFFADATNGFDGDYDAYKMLAENTYLPQVSSVSGNIKLGINGLPFPDKITTVPLNIRTGEAKDYTINVLNLENLTDYRVTLIHGTKRIDLKTNPSYTFPATVGTITNMSIEFDMSITTEIVVPSKDKTACWYSNGDVFIKIRQSGFEINSSVLIYDVNGRIVYNKRNINIAEGETVQIPVNLPRGFYITNLINKDIKVVSKIVISY